MAKCPRCNKRKAKRPCPALGYSLCPLCCGRLRNKEINCPPDCSHNKQHEEYQEKKIIESEISPAPGFSPGEDPMQDERLAWLIFHIEAPIREFMEKSTRLLDKDILFALKYVREKIEKEKLLFSPDDSPSVRRNELGERIYQVIQNCRYEGRIIMPGMVMTYAREDKLKCIDRVMLTVRQFLKRNPESMDYLHQLRERFAHLQELSRMPKILRPT